MVAVEHLQPRQFFHGSRRGPFRVGDMLGPGHTSNFGAGQPDEFVYFTPRRDMAKEFGLDASGPPDNPDQWARVYTVEPTGSYEPDTMEDPKVKSFKSRDPLRVTKVSRPVRGY